MMDLAAVVPSNSWLGLAEVFAWFFYDVIFTWSRLGTRVFRQCILTSFMRLGQEADI